MVTARLAKTHQGHLCCTVRRRFFVIPTAPTPFVAPGAAAVAPGWGYPEAALDKENPWKHEIYTPGPSSLGALHGFVTGCQFTIPYGLIATPSGFGAGSTTPEV